MWGRYLSNNLQIIYWKRCARSSTLPSSVTNPLCRYVLFNCQLGIRMTRYMTNFSNYNRAIPPTLLFLLFLSISFHSILLLFLLPEPPSLVASGKLWVENRVFKRTAQNGLRELCFCRSHNQPSLPKLYVILLRKLLFPKNIQSWVIISLIRKNNPYCHIMFRNNRDSC